MTTQEYQPPANGYRTFLILWATQSVSIIGTAVAWFALIVWLTEHSASQEELGARLAFIGLVTSIPTVFLAPIIGAFVDRHDRRRIMLVADSLSGCVSLVAIALLATNQLSFPLLVAFQFVYLLLGAFHSAAFETSYAMLVPEKQLGRANGMMQTVFSLAAVVPPALAAILLALPTGIIGALLVDVASFVLAALTLAFLRIPSPRPAEAHTAAGGPRAYLADIRTGARFVWDRRPIIWLLATFAVYNAGVTALTVLQPAIVRYQQGASASTLGLEFAGALAINEAAAGLGGIVGGVLITTWGGLRRKRIYGVLVPILVAGALQMLYGWSAWVWVSAAVLFAWVMLEPVMNSHSQAIWQTHTPREMQGRVFAVRRVIAWGVRPLATVVVGVLTARGIDAGIVVVALGLLTVVWCGVNLFNPQLAHIDDKGYLDEYAARRQTVAET